MSDVLLTAIITGLATLVTALLGGGKYWDYKTAKVRAEIEAERKEIEAQKQVLQEKINEIQKKEDENNELFKALKDTIRVKDKTLTIRNTQINRLVSQFDILISLIREDYKENPAMTEAIEKINKSTKQITEQNEGV